MSAPRALAALAAACAALCGCTDPMDVPASWHPGESLQADAAAAASDKRDLARGRAETPEDASGTTAAIRRLREDKARQLTAVSTSSAQAGGS